jgi:hypothetical protein
MCESHYDVPSMWKVIRCLCFSLYFALVVRPYQFATAAQQPTETTALSGIVERDLDSMLHQPCLQV